MPKKLLDIKILPRIIVSNLEFSSRGVSFKEKVELNLLNDYIGLLCKKNILDLEKFDLMINDGINFDKIKWDGHRVVVEEFFEKVGLL